MASTQPEAERCPKCGSERIRKERIISSIAYGLLLLGLIAVLLWPNFDEVSNAGKVAGFIGVLVALGSIWLGLSALLGKRVPKARCLDCNYEWPWG